MEIETRPDRARAYEYDLPRALIADRPAGRRDASRLLHVDRGQGRLADLWFSDLPDLIAPGDVLVVNDSRVFPARLIGERPSGARAEVLLIRPVSDQGELPTDAFDRPCPREWVALVRPGAKLKPGRRVRVSSELTIEIVDSLADGCRGVRLHGDRDPWELIQRHGHVPLPPYIERADEPDDRDRYQTVYARSRGSVAAPTAGLHFTDELLDRTRASGADVVSLTLHVGIGTFRPVSAERLDRHRLHAEAYRVGAPAADRLNRARAEGRRIWAVGTTSCRVLETICDVAGRFAPGAGWTDLFIRSPHEFRGIDCLVTNFHLPRSSLLMLVAAFAGLPLTRRAYAHAIEERYRFYSYGDAMVVT